MKRQTDAEALQAHSRQLRLTRMANKREVAELRELVVYLEALIERAEGLLRPQRRPAPRAQA